MKKLLICFTLFPLLFLSCYTPGYVGKSYPATDKIDIYLDENAIKREYEVIGYSQVSDIIDSQMQNAQQSIEKLAKSKGADGIIFEKPSSQVTGVTHTKETKEEGTTITVKSSTSDNKTASVVATFIKYK